MSQKKQVIFLASFGTSILRAKEVSYDQIQKELEAASGLPVWQIFTDDDTARAVSGIDGQTIFTVEDAVETAVIHGFEEIICVPVFFAKGELYNSLRNRLDFYRDRIDIRMTEAVLYNPASCEEVGELLLQVVKPEPSREYLFVGHGQSIYHNQGYGILEDYLRGKGYENIRVIKLKERDSVGQAIAWLKARGADMRDEQVEIVPLVVAWGDYMAGELYNSEDSFMWQLRKAGFRTIFTGKGMGEYPEFRTIYEKRLAALK
ncbi:MAG: sirohydrochlorin cobaltochelatase [Clostridia bacterium]|nr:sirohydrochlorin cobaltochelatase [Clostridia bacterium]